MITVSTTSVSCARHKFKSAHTYVKHLITQPKQVKKYFENNKKALYYLNIRHQGEYISNCQNRSLLQDLPHLFQTVFYFQTYDKKIANEKCYHILFIHFAFLDKDLSIANTININHV